MPNKLSQFWQELKRRNVVRVITVYAGAAFVIIELINNITEPLHLPEWTPTLVIVLLAIGFPIVIILSWIYAIHPEGGVVKTEPAEKVKEGDIPKSSNGWKIASYISFVVIVGLIMLNILPRAGKKGILEKSIAVLPFENMSDESEFSYLGDAMTDEIIMQLYKIYEFEVRSRTSVMQYKDSGKSTPVIGKELNVNYLLEGSAQRLNDRVRIRVQLIQAQTDEHIWAEVYEGAWENIQDIHISVAKQVAKEMKTVLSEDEIGKIERTPTDNIDAYNLYLLGRHLNRNMKEEDLNRSIGYFRQALEIDPKFSLAYYEIAYSYNSLALYGYTSRRDAMRRAKEAAYNALTLDDNLAEAHTVLSNAKMYLDWDWRGAEEGYIRAIELNPNLAEGHFDYARLLTWRMRFDKALEEYQVAHELDPVSLRYWENIGRGYYWAGKFDCSIDIFKQILERFPESENIHAHLGLALSQKGLHQEALAEIQKVSDSNAWYYFFRGVVFGNAGMKEEAQAELDHYLELSQTEFVWPIIFTFIYAGMGETEKAIEWLEETYEQGEAWMETIRVEPMFNNLRSDLRF